VTLYSLSASKTAGSAVVPLTTCSTANDHMYTQVSAFVTMRCGCCSAWHGVKERIYAPV
jgi:hypothetical protein